MDFFEKLRELLGGGRPQPQPQPHTPPAYALAGTPYKSAQEAQQAESRYNAAFNRGDLNSPDIIGVDPKYFGYAPERTNPRFVQYGPTENNIRGSIDPRWQVSRGNTPYSPGEGPLTNFNRNRF